MYRFTEDKQARNRIKLLSFWKKKKNDIETEKLKRGRYKCRLRLLTAKLVNKGC